MTPLKTTFRALVPVLIFLSFNAFAEETPESSGGENLPATVEHMVPAKCEDYTGGKRTLDPTLKNPNTSVLEDGMKVDIIGQDMAVDQIVDNIGVASAGLNDPRKPFVRLLFTGPTGVGKTETVNSLVKRLGGNIDMNVLRVDCGEFQNGHEISRLTGATASYAGYGDKPQFHKDNLEEMKVNFTTSTGHTKRINVVLIDEIEKCAPTVLKLLLGILDNGKVTTGDGSVSYFRDAAIFGTSNLGAHEVNAIIESKMIKLEEWERKAEKLNQDSSALRELYSEIPQDSVSVDVEISPGLKDTVKAKYARLGGLILQLEENSQQQIRMSIVNSVPEAAAEKFPVDRLFEVEQSEGKNLKASLDLTGRYDDNLREQIGNAQVESVERSLPPEFIARWQSIIQFLHLGEEEFLAILDKKLAEVQKRVFEYGLVKVGLSISQSLREYLASEGTDIKMGARQLDSKIENLILNPLARLMSTNQLQRGDYIMADLNEDGTVGWSIVSEGHDDQQLREIADRVYPSHEMLNVEFDKTPEDPHEQEMKKDEDDIIAQLNKNQEALKGLYQDIPQSGVPVMERVGDQEIRMSVKYARMDDQLLRIVYQANGQFRVFAVMEVETLAKETFPDDKIYSFPEAGARKELGMEEKKDKK